MNKEEWKDIPGYEGLYQVSNFGRVISIKGSRVLFGRQLKLYTNKFGRKYAVLSKNNKLKYIFIHRLVLEAFVGPCPEGMEGCHNDDDCTNNWLSNLRWDTHKNNILDCIKNDKLRVGIKNGSAKITEETVKNIKDLINKKIPMYKIAKQFGVSYHIVANIRYDRTWKHVKVN